MAHSYYRTAEIPRYPLVNTVDTKSLDYQQYLEINKFRAKNRLPALPYNRSLAQIAQLHAKYFGLGRWNIGNRCNGHSWVGRPQIPDAPFESCCYVGGNPNDKCAGTKIKELAHLSAIPYKAHAGEIWATGYGSPANMVNRGWAKSPPHTAAILTTTPNYSVGCGHNGYEANCWFGPL